ncbi:MAG TPA: hypothetical protein VEI02_13490 [Planctomycetota bacterium]|nr:hypothetical protein [Planctomycetota bacterium]
MRTSPVARRLSVVALLALAAVPLRSQTPFAYYPDDNVAPNYSAPGGWFPWFTNTTGIRIQFLVPASVFTTQGMTSLGSIGFFTGGSTPASTNATFSIFQVRIGPAALPALTNTFDNNLLPGTETLVYDAPFSTYPFSTGQWTDLPFSAPYALPGGAIIVDVRSQIPVGGAYLASTVSSTVPRVVNSAYTGQATGTLGASSGSKMRFAPGGNHLTVVTSGGGVGDLFVSLSDLDPAAASGFVFVTADVAHPVGTGPFFGIWPDGFTWPILTMPAAPGNPLHFLSGFPGLFPDVPFQLPAGTLSFLGGTSWDFACALFDATTVVYVGRTNVVRVAW